jgi:tRNA(fMet)-specific endonuclease VapC
MSASGEALLDTSVVIPFLKKDDALRQQFQNAATLYLPLTALGELYCGAYLSANPARTLERISVFLNATTLLLPTAATADHYGQIRAALAKAGTPIPENDIWIAALAKEFQLPLAARDSHFDLIAGLQVLKW